MATVISKGFREVTLDDSTEWADGRKEFFSGVMEELQQADDEYGACLIIGRKIDGVGGYFTGKDYIVRIVLPEGMAEYDEVGKTVKFKDDEQFGIFVHEACHFRHLVTDRGRFMSPSFEHLAPMEHAAFGAHLMSNAKYMEYEAGYRSLYYNEVYGMGPRELFFDLNLQNMMNYVTVEGAEEFRKELQKCKDEAAAKEVLKRFDAEFKKVQAAVKKWSDLDKFHLPKPAEGAEPAENNV